MAAWRGISSPLRSTNPTGPGWRWAAWWSAARAVGTWDSLEATPRGRSSRDEEFMVLIHNRDSVSYSSSDMISRTCMQNKYPLIPSRERKGSGRPTHQITEKTLRIQQYIFFSIQVGGPVGNL